MESNGGGVWCLSPNKSNTLLAAGCEDGTVRIFDISEDTFVYSHTLDRQESRVLSLAWIHEPESYLVTGSSDSSIRKYDTKTGRVLSRMTVDTIKSSVSGQREETLVWKIQVLKDGTIVSGDSLGNIGFWNSTTGTLLQGLKAHKADVLCLTTNDSNDSVWSSGVDRKIIQFTKLIKKSTDDSNNTIETSSWIMSGERRYHSHDVRAIAYYNQPPNQLYRHVIASGGVDTTLMLGIFETNEFKNVKLRRLQPFPHRPLITFSPESRRLLVRFAQGTTMKLYKLGESLPGTVEFMNEGDKVDMKTNWEPLAELNIDCQANLITSTIAPKGDLVACSDGYVTKLLRLYEFEGVLDGVRKVAIRLTDPDNGEVMDSLPGATAIAISPDSTKLVLATSNSEVLVIDLIRGVILRRFLQHQRELEPSAPITELAISQDGQWLVSGDLNKSIHVYNLDSLQYHTSLPKLSSQFTTFRFHPTNASPILFVVTTDYKIIEYDIEQKCLSEFTKKYSPMVPKKLFKSRTEKIIGMAFPTDGKLWLWGTESWVIIDWHAKTQTIKPSHTKRKRIQPTPTEQQTTFADANFKLVERYQPIMFMDCLSGDEVVVIERPLLALLEGLGEGFYAPRYGS